VPATFLGSFPVGGSLPGVLAVLEPLADALNDLRAAASAALAVLTNARETIDSQVTLLGAAQTAIRIPAAAELDAQLTAALNLEAGLSVQVSDPATYVAGLLNGVSQLQARLDVLVPSVALSAQAGAAAAVAGRLEAKIGAIDLELAALTDISAALQSLVASLLDVEESLADVLAATLGLVGSAASLLSQLASAGAACLLYSGPLSGLGAALDAETPATGFSPGDSVVAPIVIVPASNTAGVSGINSAFRVA